MDKFDQFLVDSFHDGIYQRELRLSVEELQYVKAKYPHSIIKNMSSSSKDEKQWYHIHLTNESK